MENPGLDTRTITPPQQLFTIGGEQINILKALDEGKTRFSVPVDKMKPGDGAAMQLIRHLGNIQTTPHEYLIAMPRLLQYAARKEGGFDTDFIAVAEYLLLITEKRMGNHAFMFPTEKRIAYFSNVFGQLEFIKDFIWNDPAVEAKKKQLVGTAKGLLDQHGVVLE